MCSQTAAYSKNQKYERNQNISILDEQLINRNRTKEKRKKEKAALYVLNI